MCCSDYPFGIENSCYLRKMDERVTSKESSFLPPQNWPRLLRRTCHGWLCGTACRPPTIRLEIPRSYPLVHDIPHSANRLFRTDTCFSIGDGGGREEEGLSVVVVVVVARKQLV